MPSLLSLLGGIYWQMIMVTSIYRQHLHRVVKRYVHLLPNSALLLDVGSGSMPYRSLFKPRRFISLETTRECKPLVQGDVYALPLHDRVMDAVLCTEVVEHLLEPPQALQEMWRVLKANGYLFLSVPFLVGMHCDSYGDYYRWTELGLRKLLANNRFEVISIHPLGGLFSAIAEAILVFPHEFFTPPTRFYGTVKGVPFYLAGAIARLLLLPGATILALLDLIYRHRSWTLGYVVICRKVGN